MQSEIPWFPLEEVVDDILDRRGVTPFKLGGDFSPGGHRVISAKVVKAGRVQLDADEPRYVNQSIYRKWMRTPLCPGDVIMTSEAPLGELAFLGEDVDWVLGQRLFAIRPKAGVLHGRFLYYALQTEAVRADMHGRASGTTVQGIRQSELRRVRIPLPSLATQIDVSDLLGGLDDRIDLLRQTNATLESIAQALFKSWFIDFDPVRAKAEGREPEGMDAATAALFPGEFEEAELGLIPYGWSAGALADFSALNAASWTTRRAPAEVAYVDLAGVKSNVFDPPQRFVFAEAPSRARRELKAGDTLVGTVRPGNRSFGFIAEAEAGLTGSTGFAVLSPTSAIAAAFVYLGATRSENIDRLAALADGGAYPAVRPELVHSTTCVMPPKPVLEAFHAVASPLLFSVAANTQRARCLAKLRDSLLPRLISGKLRIPEAQIQLENALA